MKENVAIFINDYDRIIPTLEEYTDFIRNSAECNDIGDLYGGYWEERPWFKHKPIETIIKTVLKSKLYDWLIGSYNSATVLLSYKGYKRILINPTVNEYDLKNVSEFDKENTYGFFDNKHEADYELFQLVYTYSLWFMGMEELQFSDVQGIITEILEVSQSDKGY